MKKLLIFGGRLLEGEVRISGAKNAVLPIMAASLLTDEDCIIENVPQLSDVFTMMKLLSSLGKKLVLDKNTLIIKSTSKKNYIAPYQLVKTMRASFCVLGPLLAKFKKAKVSLPGGCVIGVRPVDLHLKGLKLLGAKIKISSGYVEARCSSLKGNSIFLEGPFGPSVTATENILMASVLAKGTTLIENASCEPEVVDLVSFLKKMGAKIEGEGSAWIRVKGVDSLGGAYHKVIPDRIETGTFIMASLITGGKVVIKDCNPHHLTAVIEKLKEAGAKIKFSSNCIQIYPSKLQGVNITTHPYPGFPTDLQAQFMSLMCVSRGVSVIKEDVFPDRFMHVPELNRMGAKIKREGPYAIVEGVSSFSPAPVVASDLRASAALVLAGLNAKGRTEVQRIYHLERGYENLHKKLQKLGAKVRIVE